MTPFTVLALFFALLLSGCAGVSVYKNDAVTAYGGSGIDERKEVAYYMVRINADKIPASLQREISILLPNAKNSILISDLNIEYVSNLLPNWQPPLQWSEYLRNKTFEENKKRGIEDFSYDGTYIAFKNKALWQINLCSNCEGKQLKPALLFREGVEEGSRLPLSEDELRIIFGDAKTISTQNEIYY